MNVLYHNLLHSSSLDEGIEENIGNASVLESLLSAFLCHFPIIARELESEREGEMQGGILDPANDNNEVDGGTGGGCVVGAAAPSPDVSQDGTSLSLLDEKLKGKHIFCYNMTWQAYMKFECLRRAFG